MVRSVIERLSLFQGLLLYTTKEPVNSYWSGAVRPFQTHTANQQKWTGHNHTCSNEHQLYCNQPVGIILRTTTSLWLHHTVLYYIVLYCTIQCVYTYCAYFEAHSTKFWSEAKNFKVGRLQPEQPEQSVVYFTYTSLRGSTVCKCKWLLLLDNETRKG